MLPALSRRRFAQALGAGMGAALLEPALGRRAEASLPTGVPADAIQLDSNENPYGPSPRALEALTRAQAVASRYPAVREDDLRDSLARLHGVGPASVLLGCGSSEVLRMAASAFLGPGRTLVAAEPTFEAVLRYAGVTQAETVKVPLTADFRHDLPAMAAACGERTGLVYVCNPNNPTGTVVSGEELAAFLARVPASAVVLVDEAYHHFVESPGYRSAFEFLARTPELEKAGRAYIASEANFVMIDVGADVTPLIEAFRQRKILVGRRFASLPNWLRVSMGTRPEMEAFLAALGEVAPRAPAEATKGDTIGSP